MHQALHDEIALAVNACLCVYVDEIAFCDSATYPHKHETSTISTKAQELNIVYRNYY